MMKILKISWPNLLVAIGLPLAFLCGRLTSPGRESAVSLIKKEERTSKRIMTREGEGNEGRDKRAAHESPEQHSEIFDFEGYRRVTSPAGAKELLQDLLSSMSSDPDRTFAFAQENEGILGEDGIELLLLEWTMIDPKAAWEMTKFDYPERTDEILGEMGRFDPELALKLAKEFHKGDFMDGHAAISGIIRGAYFDGGYENAIGLIELLGKENYGEGSRDSASLYQVVLDEWTRYSPEDAAQWVQSFADDGSGTKAKVQEALVENWTYHDPNSSLQYFLNELPEGDFRTEGITSALTAWAGEDIHAASGWIVDNGLSAEFDEAAYHVALSGDLLEEYPERSLEWMRSLSDPELQNKGLGKVYLNWLRNDPEAAGAHLEAAGGEVAQELRESIQAEYEAALEREQTGQRTRPQ